MGSGPGEQLLWRPEEHSCLGNSTPAPPFFSPSLHLLGLSQRMYHSQGSPAQLGWEGMVAFPSPTVTTQRKTRGCAWLLSFINDKQPRVTPALAPGRVHGAQRVLEAASGLSFSSGEAVVRDSRMPQPMLSPFPCPGAREAREFFSPHRVCCVGT